MAAKKRNKYEDIVRHIPLIEDHGHLYMYYGEPYNKKCHLYDDDLVLSDECYKLCLAIEKEYGKDDSSFLDVLFDYDIGIENALERDIESLDFEAVEALLVILIVSMRDNDMFIDALKNGLLLKLLKRLRVIGNLDSSNNKNKEVGEKGNEL